jgi:hypothetical protein
LNATRTTTGWPVEMPPAIPPAWLARNSGPSARAHRIGVLLAGQARGGEAIADLDALDRVDAHHRGGQIGIELAIERRAPAGRNAGGDAFDHRAERGAGLAAPRRPASPSAWRPPHRGRRTGCCRSRPRRTLAAVDRIAADLADIAGDRHFRDHQPRHRARRHPRRGLARRAAPAAAIVAKAVLGVIGIVGMAGAIGLGDFGIVLRALVGVLDHQADRRAGGLALEHARQDAHLRPAPAAGW